MIKTISDKLKKINIKIKYMVNNSNIAHMLFKISHCTLLLGQDLLHNSLYITGISQNVGSHRRWDGMYWKSGKMYSNSTAGLISFERRQPSEEFLRRFGRRVGGGRDDTASPSNLARC